MKLFNKFITTIRLLLNYHSRFLPGEMSCDTDDSETADSISVTKPPEIDGGSGDASNISSYTDTISTTNADHSDLELDALLNDAVKGFDSINKKSGKSSSSSSGVKLSSSGKKSTASVGTKAKTKQPVNILTFLITCINILLTALNVSY